MAGWFLSAKGRLFSPQERNASAKETTKATKQGVIPEPTKCERCWVTNKDGYVGYHSEDYSDPLTVVSLCWRCHMVRHSEIRGAVKEADAYWQSLQEGKKWPALKQGNFKFMSQDHGIRKGRSDDPTVNPEMVQHMTEAQRKQFVIPDRQADKPQAPVHPEKHCEICGQTEGKMMREMLHPGAPFVDVCLRCFLVMHAQDRAPKETQKYFRAVQKGKRWPAMTELDFMTITRDHGITYETCLGTVSGHKEDQDAAPQAPKEHPRLETVQPSLFGKMQH